MANGIMLECESEVSPLVTSTDLTIKAEVFEKGGTAPTSIIRADQDWYVDVEWAISGMLVRHFCGTWHVRVNLESVGPGDDYEFPESEAAKIPMEPCGDGKYKHRIDIPAGKVSARDKEGTQYIVGVTLGSTDPCDAAGHLYGNCKGLTLQFVPGPPHGS